MKKRSTSSNVRKENNQTTRAPHAAQISKEQLGKLRSVLIKGGQYILPMVEMIEQSRMAVDELINCLGRATIEAVLMLSAQQVAGPKRQGKRDGGGGPVGWHSVQRGRVNLAERRLTVNKPRLRGRGTRSEEVEIPAYTAMQADGRLGERMIEILMNGVSTRSYEKVLPEMADTVGISKSSVSREFIQASGEELKQLSTRDRQFAIGNWQFQIRKSTIRNRQYSPRTLTAESRPLPSAVCFVLLHVRESLLKPRF